MKILKVHRRALLSCQRSCLHGHHHSLWYSELPLLTVNILNGLCQQEYVLGTVAVMLNLFPTTFCQVSDLCKKVKKSMTPLTSLQAHSCSCWGVKISPLYKLSLLQWILQHFRSRYRHFHVIFKPELRSCSTHGQNLLVFSLRSLFWGGKKRQERNLKRAPCCLSVCVSAPSPQIFVPVCPPPKFLRFLCCSYRIRGRYAISPSQNVLCPKAECRSNYSIES
jgi:hypothetical protein